MSNNKAYNLKELLSTDKYIIPIYQRNYTWGKAEISQLIRDINEFDESPQNDEEKSKNYYLGSLVCFKRENSDFELIDGQQRHTTISLINAVLKNWISEDLENKIANVVLSTNLKFDSRKHTQRFLEELYSTSDFQKYIKISNISGTQSFKDAINFIKEEFNEKDFDVSKFADKFYNKVKLFRIEVPQETDLNHYFEIMNNRGEQLEKHEIVKAHLMKKINDDDEKRAFAAIWDACSDMNNYVWFNLNSKNRTELFTSGELIGDNFDNVKEKIDVDKDDESATLLDVLNNKEYQVPEDFSQEINTPKEKYKSVVDFPNFLLQVLKLQKQETSLDDRNLLNVFQDNEIDSREFIFSLLKYRCIFDKYIIKQDLSNADEEKQNWSIRKPNEKFEDIIKTFESDDELIKLQTMLYYANPSNTNNYWVHEVLREKYFENDINEFSEKVFSEIAKPRFNNANLKYPEITAYNLYFIDFLLWKTYKEKVQGKENTAFDNQPLEFKISKNKDLFNSFKFRQINSKEHLLPQSKATEEEKGVLNSLGNLCLISTSQNSSANNQHPSYKRNKFKDDNSSLKRLIMFESFNGEEWGVEKIQKHEEEINELINSYL